MYIKSLEKALAYIESHLCDNIDLSLVAKEAGYSLYHFHRIFSGILGDSIKEYIRKRRITEAAKELCNTKESIVDVAFKYGYQSREAFSRAFEKVYGINPSDVKKDGSLYYIREPIDFNYLMFEYNRKIKGLKPNFIKMDDRIVVGEKYKVNLDGSNLQFIPLLWQKWNQEKRWEKIIERKYEGECLGICIHSGDDVFDYMIAHEVKSTNEVPQNMEVYILESSLYAVFKTIGPITETVQKTWEYIYTIWFSEVEYTHAGKPDIEYYYYHQGELMADLYVPIICK